MLSKIKIILLLLLFWSKVSNAHKDIFHKHLLEIKKKGLIHYQKVSFSEKELKILVFSKSGKHKLRIFEEISDKEITLLALEKEALLNGFMSAQKARVDSYINPLIIIKWSKGVHGEYVNIFDPIKRKIIYHLKSTYNIKTMISDSKISFEYTPDSDKDGNFTTTKINWFNPRKIK